MIMHIKEKQKISVLIPNFNDSENLEKTIFSIVKQKLKPYEIVIVDDGSTDQSLEVMKKLKIKFGKIIKLKKNEKNIGIANTLNQHLNNLNGDFFFLGSANDEIPINFFHEIFNSFPINKDIKVIYGNIKITHQNKNQIVKPLGFYETKVVSPIEYKNIFLKKNPLGFSLTPSAIYHKSVFKEYKFDTFLKSYQDTYMTNNICLKYKSLYINKTIAIWKFDENSYSQKRKIINNIEIYLNFVIAAYKGKLIKYYGVNYILRWVFFYPFKFLNFLYKNFGE